MTVVLKQQQIESLTKFLVSEGYLVRLVTEKNIAKFRASGYKMYEIEVPEGLLRHDVEDTEFGEVMLAKSKVPTYVMVKRLVDI